ncbi:MAG: hypothetical protein AAF411_31855 [Myxococcota bacterium]
MAGEAGVAARTARAMSRVADHPTTCDGWSTRNEPRGDAETVAMKHRSETPHTDDACRTRAVRFRVCRLSFPFLNLVAQRMRNQARRAKKDNCPPTTNAGEAVTYSAPARFMRKEGSDHDSR